MQRYLAAKNYNICFPNEMDLSVLHKTDRYGCNAMLLLVSDHTTPGKFENGSFKSTVRPIPSTPIRHHNGSFRKRSSNQRNLKTLCLRFRVDRKYFVNVAFRKRWCHDNHDNHLIFLTEFYSNTMTGDCCVHRFPQRRLSERKTFDAFSDGVKPLFQISVKHLPE